MRKLAKRLVQGVTAAGVALAATAAVAAPAHAGGNDIYWSMTYRNYALVGDAKFYSYDEILKIWDDEPDGHGVGVRLQLKDANGNWYTWATAYNGGGNGSVATYNYDIGPEGRAFRFQTCLRDGSGGTLWNCGDWVGGTI